MTVCDTGDHRLAAITVITSCADGQNLTVGARSEGPLITHNDKPKPAINNRNEKPRDPRPLEDHPILGAGEVRPSA